MFTNRKAVLRASCAIWCMFRVRTPTAPFLDYVGVSERRLVNDLLGIHKENWVLCAELQRYSC